MQPQKTGPTLDVTEVAKLLTEYGRHTALAGGNPYRAKAYIRAAENLACVAEPLDRIIAEDRLREIPGVGNAIARFVSPGSTAPQEVERQVRGWQARFTAGEFEGGRWKAKAPATSQNQTKTPPGAVRLPFCPRRSAREKRSSPPDAKAT